MSTLLNEELAVMRSNGTAMRYSILEPNTTTPTSMVFTVLLLVISSLGILTSLVLLLGLHLNNRWMFVPWVATIIQYIIVEFVYCLYIFFQHTLKFNPLNSILFTIDFFVLIIKVYALLCVISQYQELKAGRGRGDDDGGNLPNIHYNAQPTATSLLRRATTYNDGDARLSPTQSPTGTGGGEEPSPNAATTAAGRGHRKSVKFPDQQEDRGGGDGGSPTHHHNGRGALLEPPWSIDIVKAPLVKHPDTTPLIEPPVVVNCTQLV